jgi:proline-specific peptidase
LKSKAGFMLAVLDIRALNRYKNFEDMNLNKEIRPYMTHFSKYFRQALAACLVFFISACGLHSGQTVREGYVAVTGGKVWYRITGSGNATPVILLHGGPGSSSDYLRPLEGLSVDRPVIIYDQLGCGRSDNPDNDELWRIERFVEELGQVRSGLKLKEVHLYGHSWGTMLAVDYMLKKPAGVKSLTLASPCLSVTRWADDARQLIEKLPFTTRQVIKRHEQEGTTNSEEYEAAVAEYLKSYLCRLTPWPPELLQAFDRANQKIYRMMWGPSEWLPTGNLKTYERVERLHEIKVPTLFTAGRHDEATPGATAWYRSHVPGSMLRIFEQSSHLAMFEEQDAYLESIREFLKAHD